jgi:hypothetical protein
MNVRSCVAVLLALNLAVMPLASASAPTPMPLPAVPASLSPAPVSDQATLLARQVLAGGSGARQALLQALGLAGMPVRNADGSYLVQPAGANQHVGFSSWEIEAMMKAMEHGVALAPLTSLGAAMQDELAPFKGADVAALIAGGIRTDAQSPDPALRFWAQFIIALGREGTQHYDLSTESDMSKIDLDAIQTALVLRRLAADLYVASRTAAASAPGSVRVAEIGTPDFGQPVRIADAKPPCDPSEGAGQIMELGGSIQSEGFDKLLEYVAEHVHAYQLGISKAQAMSAAFNIIAAWAQLLLTYLSLLEFKITMDKPPLRRNKTRAAGEQRELVATVRINAKNWTWTNCFKNALATVGLDTGDIFHDGPVSDAAVEWKITEGQALVDYRGIETARVPTDEAGESHVIIEGKARPDDLPDFSTDVEKQATVAGLLQLQRANIKEDFVSAIGQPRSILAFLTVPVELIKRTTLLTKVASYTFAVIDYDVNLELLMDSTFDEHQMVSGPGAWDYTMHYHMNADVPISLETVQGLQNRSYALLGQAPPASYTGKMLECSCQARYNSSYDGPVLVVADPMKVRLAQNFGVTLVLGITLTRDDFWVRCGPEQGDMSHPPIFSGLFTRAHRSEQYIPRQGLIPGVTFTISDWQRGSGAVLARKVYDRGFSCNDSPGQPCVAHEHTVLELRRPATSAQGK